MYGVVGSCYVLAMAVSKGVDNLESMTIISITKARKALKP
jgi:hypothetical protein